MTTVFLPADMQLTVSPAALSSGSLVRLSDAPGGEPYAPVALSASTDVTVGPFATPRRYQINTTQGTITYAVAEVAETDAGNMGAQSPAAVAITGGTIAGTDFYPVTTEYLVNGAIAPSGGVAVLTKATAGAYTLAAPAAALDGVELHITSATAAAHVVTATGLLEDGVTGGAKDTATFAAFIGASATLVAFDGAWHVKSLNAVTIA